MTSLVEKVYACADTPSGRQVDSVYTYLGIAESHSRSNFSSSPAMRRCPPSRRPRRVVPASVRGGSVAVVVEGVGEVEAERSTAADPGVGDVQRVGALRAVDVDDG